MRATALKIASGTHKLMKLSQGPSALGPRNKDFLDDYQGSKYTLAIAYVSAVCVRGCNTPPVQSKAK